jgi:hypothetical protein
MSKVPRAAWQLGGALASAWALAGCEASLEPIHVGTGCPEAPLRGPLEFADEPRERLIDDFEDTDDHLTLVGGRDGSWIIGKDGSSNPGADNSTHCAARGEHAGHFTGAGFLNWGANWTAVFKKADASGTAVAYDATAYKGISFWAATGPEAAPPYALPVGVTTLDVAWNGGICSVCMDYYRTSVDLTPEWQRFVVPFASLAQTGEGNPLTALKPEELVGFIMWPTRDFDIWIDDVRFEP